MGYKTSEERDREVLVAISKYMEQHHHLIPSMDELVAETGIKAKSQVYEILNRIEQRGWINRVAGRARSISLTEPGRQVLDKLRPVSSPNARRQTVFFVNHAAMIHTEKTRRQIKLPILGRTFAGELTMLPGAGGSLFGPNTTLSIYDDMLPGRIDLSELFVLEVQGDSMIEANIFDGNYIVVRRADSAHNGELAVIWFDDTQETTLKYFFKEKDCYRLQPANSTMQPIIVDQSRTLRVVGKVVTVLAPGTMELS